MSEWKISEIAEILSGGTPKTQILEYWNGNIPWLSVKDFNNDDRYVYQAEKTITEEGLAHCSSVLLQKDDIIISARGTVGELAMIPYPMAFNQSCYGLRARENIVDPTFLYYLLKNNLRKLKQETHGSVFDTITRRTFDVIVVNIPELEKQKKIAGVLSAFDNKIEINKRINDNLQQQAQAIYRLLFVTNAKSTWPKGHLSDLVKVKYGKDHKNLANGKFPLYGSGGIMRYVERPLYEKESVLIPRKGTLNNVIYVNQPFWSVDTMFYTEMRLPNIAKFVYHFIKSKNLEVLNAGSAVPSMTTAILNALEVCIPPSTVLNQFETAVSPFYKAIQGNNKQIETLGEIRDGLLPKLISGQLV